MHIFKDTVCVFVISGCNLTEAGGGGGRRRTELYETVRVSVISGYEDPRGDPAEVREIGGGRGKKGEGSEDLGQREGGLGEKEGGTRYGQMEASGTQIQEEQLRRGLTNFCLFIVHC